MDQITTLTTESKDLLTVHALGGKLTFSFAEQPILISTTRGDGKTGITHLCTPIFGPDRNKVYGLSQHGNTRNEVCDVEKRSPAEISVKHIITDSGYPTGVVVELTITLEKHSAMFRMAHTNTGTEKAAVNAGLHFYFDAPKGFSGTKVNGSDITEIITNNSDGGLIPLSEVNTLHIPGKPELFLSQKGFTKAMLWVGRNKETGEIDKNYVCIEPVENDPLGDFFGSPESMIQPGETRTSECMLRY